MHHVVPANRHQAPFSSFEELIARDEPVRFLDAFAVNLEAKIPQEVAFTFIVTYVNLKTVCGFKKCGILERQTVNRHKSLFEKLNLINPHQPAFINAAVSGCAVLSVVKYK